MDKQSNVDELFDFLDDLLPDTSTIHKQERSIAESIKPTFENVSREFIIRTMDKILFSDEFPNFRFEFREDEAIDFIEGIIKDYPYKKERLKQVLESIKKGTDDNETQPVMIISDYKKFFELLRQVYEQDIEMFFKRTKFSSFPVYEMENFLKEIWLRATPEDFNDPENFLRKQAEILRDKTFEKYDEETCLGQLGFLDNHILCVKNGVARTWDENLREMEFTIYDKNHYNNQQLFLRPHYTLPVIRYGIYEKDGRKICVIGSIQNKTITEGDNDSGLDKEIERKKYKVNKDVPQEDTSKIEPKNILALSIFISLLNREGITEIEAPGMFVLDHEYHKKRGEKTSRDFINEWTEERREREPDRYKWEYEYLQRNYKKEDLISEIKTERFIRVLTRLLHHYPNGLIKSYPGEVDSFLHLSIPIIKNKDEIRGDILKDIYSLIRKEKTEVER